MEHRRLTEDEQRSFVDDVLARTDDAVTAVGAEPVICSVAGVRIQIQFVGGAARFGMLDALNHLRIDESVPGDVVLTVWDHAASGVAVPRAPLPRTSFTDRGDLWGMSSSRHRVAFHWLEGSLNCYDADRGVGAYWVPDPSHLTASARAAPLRSLLHWVLSDRGIQLLHAAAIGSAAGALVLTGKGGSGKSTTALLCARFGMGYLGDDYVAIAATPVPTVHSLYASAKVLPSDASRHRDLVVGIEPTGGPGNEKTILNVSAIHPDALVRSARLCAVLAPVIVNEQATRVGPIDEIMLRRAASFTTLSQLPGAGQETQDRINAALGSVPGFELRLGRDEPSTIEAIRAVLADPELVAARIQSHRGRAPTESAWEKKTVPVAPLITVIVPVHNGAHFLPDAVSSIMSQGYPSLEIIVVDDGSTDDITMAVERLPVDVRFFRQEHDGPASARNRGIRDASANLIAFLDVDDLWPEGTLAVLVDELERHPDCLVVHGHAQLLHLGDDGRFVPEGNPAESFPHYIGAGLYRKAAFETVGLFDQTMWFAEDTDWYSRLAEVTGPARRIPVVTLHVRRHGANMTAAKSSKDLRGSLLVAFKKSLDRARGRALELDAPTEARQTFW